MLKSYRQQRIEAKNDGREFRDIFLHRLEQSKGTGTALVPLIALHFQVSTNTVYNWCRDLEIDLNDYR